MQFPWEERPERNHGKSLDLGPFLIDRDLAAQLQRASANYSILDMRSPDRSRTLTISGI